MYRTEKEWIQEYQRRDALWIHDGSPERPHALLTSGNHSSGFFNSRPVISDEGLLQEAAHDLVGLFIVKTGYGIQSTRRQISCVVGPQTGATRLAELMSRQLNLRTAGPCRWASPENRLEGDELKMVFSDSRHTVRSGDEVLLCEDVLTTGGSVDRTALAVREKDAYPWPLVLVLVNRSGEEYVDDRRILALTSREMPIWTPEECPLCKEGSEAIRPKDHWKQLTATY